MDKLIQILSCPVCRSSVELKSDSLFCPRCHNFYEIQDGIPIMLPQKSYLQDSLQLTLRKWGHYYSNLTMEEIARQKRDYEALYGPPVLKHIDQSCQCDRTHSSYLEIGCGLGFLGLEMNKRGYSVYGLDICIEALKAAKNLYEREGITGYFVCGDLLNMPFKRSSFDLIYGGGVIEHFDDTIGAVRALYAVLRKEGIAFNTVPVISLSTFYRQIWGNIPELPLIKPLAKFVHTRILKEKYMKFGYEKSFTKTHLMRMFRDCHFKWIRIDLLDVFLPMTFVRHDGLRQVLRRLAKSNLFWPMVYICAKK